MNKGISMKSKADFFTPPFSSSMFPSLPSSQARIWTQPLFSWARPLPVGYRSPPLLLSFQLQQYTSLVRVQLSTPYYTPISSWGLSDLRSSESAFRHSSHRSLQGNFSSLGTNVLWRRQSWIGSILNTSLLTGIMHFEKILTAKLLKNQVKLSLKIPKPAIIFLSAQQRKYTVFPPPTPVSLLPVFLILWPFPLWVGVLD